MASKPYNGHKNYNHWNVSLWIANDEPLYRLALEAIRVCPNRDAAVRYVLDSVPANTPDGVPYTKSAVRAALVGLE